MQKHVALIAVLAAACSSAPIQYYGVAPQGLGTAYDCAVAQLNTMGYVIEAATDGIVVKGRKYRSGDHYPDHDVLSAAVYDNPRTGETNLRVTVTATEWDTIGDGPVEVMGGPSKTGKADARSLLHQCGVGDVVAPPATALPSPRTA